MSKYININNLSFFKALASETRIKILESLVEREMNIQDLSGKLNVSNVIISKHVNILEAENIIQIRKEPGKRGTQKICSLVFKDYSLRFTSQYHNNMIFNEYEIPIGKYKNYDIKPTCGLATVDGILGECDDTRYFSHFQKENIGILWFSEGWIEYVIPSFVIAPKSISKIELTLEISSESPKFNDNYQSDIYFYFNNIKIAKYITTGDFGKIKGKHTPSWWVLSQYGVVVNLSITKRATFIDHIKVSDITLNDLNLHKDVDNILKISSPRNTENPGGLNLFGKGFGSLNSHILLKTTHYK